jgi:adenosylhomocysteine nucleosidase
LTPTTKLAIIAALEREVRPLIKNWTRIPRDHEGRTFTFFEHAGTVLLCGGIGMQAARRAAEAAIALYHPAIIHSVGFAGALDSTLQVGDLFSPSIVLDARDGSRTQLPSGEGTLLSFMNVASSAQKSKLAQAYAAQAIDMEAAAVAASAAAHGISFAVTKVISDDLNFEMPNLSSYINHEGQFKTMNFVLFATLRPCLWKRLFVLAGTSRRASRALAAHLQSSSPESLATASSALPTGGHR